MDDRDDEYYARLMKVPGLFGPPPSAAKKRRLPPDCAPRVPNRTSDVTEPLKVKYERVMEYMRAGFQVHEACDEVGMNYDLFRTVRKWCEGDRGE
jgi:hypothetical protein